MFLTFCDCLLFMETINYLPMKTMVAPMIQWRNYMSYLWYLKIHKTWLASSCVLLIILVLFIYIWRPPSLSELTPIIFSAGLTHLGSETSIYVVIVSYLVKTNAINVNILTNISNRFDNIDWEFNWEWRYY